MNLFVKLKSWVSLDTGQWIAQFVQFAICNIIHFIRTFFCWLPSNKVALNTSPITDNRHAAQCDHCIESAAHFKNNGLGSYLLFRQRTEYQIISYITQWKATIFSRICGTCRITELNVFIDMRRSCQVLQSIDIVLPFWFMFVFVHGLLSAF